MFVPWSAEQRVCVTVRWDLTQLLMVCLCLCCLEELQVSVPPPLSCGEQQGSAIPASSHSPGVIISETQHSLVSGFGVPMDVSLGKVVVQGNGGVRVNRFCLQ